MAMLAGYGLLAAYTGGPMAQASWLQMLAAMEMRQLLVDMLYLSCEQNEPSQ